MCFILLSQTVTKIAARSIFSLKCCNIFSLYEFDIEHLNDIGNI